MAKQTIIKKGENEKLKQELASLKKQISAMKNDAEKEQDLEKAEERAKEIQELLSAAIVIDDSQEVLTQAGLDNLKKQLDFLKSVRRIEVAEKLKEARAHGDLSENSEYDEAKAEKEKLEYDISKLEDAIKHAVVIDEVDTTRVGIGSKVTVYCPEFEEEDTYHIVGASEVDALNDKISDKSPIGSALLGHQIGDEVSVVVPDGTITLQVKGITK